MLAIVAVVAVIQVLILLALLILFFNDHDDNDHKIVSEYLHKPMPKTWRMSVPESVLR